MPNERVIRLMLACLGSCVVAFLGLMVIAAWALMHVPH